MAQPIVTEAFSKHIFAGNLLHLKPGTHYNQEGVFASFNRQRVFFNRTDAQETINDTLKILENERYSMTAPQQANVAVQLASLRIAADCTVLRREEPVWNDLATYTIAQLSQPVDAYAQRKHLIRLVGVAENVPVGTGADRIQKAVANHIVTEYGPAATMRLLIKRPNFAHAVQPFGAAMRAGVTNKKTLQAMDNRAIDFREEARRWGLNAPQWLGNLGL